ncbi:helix-turn-helix domain-containing protein [Nocardioides mesophilus]|uniref:Helix-turn-helix domain-containing protein n=1 Tax=Nocardioides mesophilus TaxID=433659 RepID=A0A7G9RHE8_9ACTN|nr:helix-turn-helix domain-containing protein [Nocardioides mesophilus]
MSRSRAALLDVLQDQPEATTMAALTAATGLHANTLREHLDALERHGLVRRHRAEPNGRGRPAWLYEATGAEDSPGRSEYAGLASALASAIHRSSSTPREDAIAAGTEWGHELAQARAVADASGREPDGPDGPGGPDGLAGRRRVLALLDEVGFAPEADEDATVVRLTRCPLLEAAHRHPDIVCGVHLGIVRGALEEYGADPAGTDLVPFAEPGACRLHLLDPGAGR